MYGNSDKPVDFSKKPRVVPRKIKNNVYKGLTYRELGYNLGRANPDFEAVAEDKLVTKNYLEMRCELPAQTRSTFLMVFSPDGKKVASTHGNHNVYVTDLTTGKNINTLSGHPRTPWCIAFHPSSNQILATGCLGGQVRVWDLHGGSEVWKAEGQTVIASLAFHPTNRMLVIATYNELHFWDWSQSAPFAKCYTKNEREKLRYVAFDPLGHKLITGISNVPPHSTQWDRSAGSHHLSHHHHLYHHQPFHRTAARHHALYCTHHQQSTNVPGERSEEQLERDGRFNDGISYLSSPREGRTQNGTWEVTSSSTSATSPPPDYERRISVCYRSLAQRYEQLLQRYFDLVRPRFVVTTDRGTDPMEAEETSGSINNAATSNSTNRCTCNNTATSTDNNWTVRNSSSSTTATTSKTKARKSTRGFSSAVDSSSNSSASNVNGARAVNSQARSNSCPCFHEGSTGNVSMCCRICPSSSSSSLGKCSHTPAAVGSSGVRSTLTLDASNSTNCANVQSDDRQALPNVLCPRPIGIVCNEGFSRKPEGQTSQSANSLSVNFSSRETSDTSHMPNENRLSSSTMTRPPESVVTVTTYNRTETEQADHAAIIDPASTRTVPDMEYQNDFDEQETSGVVNIDQETTLLPSTQTGSSPTSTLTSQIYEQHSPDDDVSSTRRKLTGQPPPQAQVECTISNNHQRQLAGAEQELTSHQDDDQQQQQQPPSEPPSQSTSHVGATSAMYRDVRRLRYGIYCLNQQIDSIQRLCRARMEILQLQQIRRVWGNLQRQMNSLHGAVHQTPQSDSPGLVITEEDEPYQPAREPNVSQLQEPIVSQLLELARISDGEPADESSELHASSSSSDPENDDATECVQFVTEEAAPGEICQDRTDDGEIAAKRVKIDPQSSSTKTQWEHVADGDSAGSNIQNTAAELATGSADSPINEKAHRHGTIAKSGRNNMEVNSCSSGRLAMTEETSEINAVELHSRHNGSVPEVTNEFAVSKSNIPSETFQETGTKDIGSHVTRQERHSIQEQSTQMKGEKLVEHNLPVAGLMTAGCSSASCSTSQNSDYTAAPSQTSRGLKVSPVYSSGRGKTGRNIDDITPRNTFSHQERINEMQNMVKGLQERINQRRIAEQQEITLPEREPTSLWKSCPSHMAKVASTRVSRNCGSHHPNTTPLHPSLPRLQPTTLHLGTHVAQPQPIYTTVRPQEVVASSHSRPTNLVPHGSISCKSFEQTHNEMRTSDSGNVQGEEVSRVTKNESSSTETTDKQECGRKLDDPKNISCVLRTRCKVNSQESLNHVQLTSVTQRTNEERGENSASSQCNNSTEQEIPVQELWGETKHIQNLVRSSNVTAGVSNNGSNETASENETISHSDLIVPSQEEVPCATTVINVTNKQNVNCLHPGMNRTHNVQNNFVDANPCSPAGNPADLLSETAAYPANIHPFIPGVVTNFCGNLGESSSDRPDAQQNTHQNSAPEDLSSPERRAVSVGDHSAQVNPSCQQNDDDDDDDDDDDGGDDTHGVESTSSSLHFGNSSVQGASTRATVSRSSWRSDAVVSQSESSPNAVRCHIAQRPNPSIIPRQGPLMCPQPDTLLSPRPGPLLTPRASPLLIPGSVQASLRCPRMLHVGGRYYVPRPRFHHRTGHCSRGRIFSRPVTPAEQLRRPWFLQTLTQTYRSSTGRSGEEPGGRCNEFIRQIGAAPRNPVSRPTRSCTNHMQQRGSHGSSNQCGENGESCLRWKHSVESSNDNSERNYNEQHVESILPASPNNHRETVFESRVETAVNMTKGQTLSCDSETSEQSGESSSSKPSVSVTSEEFVSLNSMACTELPEAEVQQPVLPSSLDSGETSTDIKNVCAGGKTVSQAVSEIPHSSLSPVSGSNDSAPFCTHLDTPAMKKGVSHSVSQNVRCKADQSATVRESIPSSSSHSQSTIIENSNSSQCTVLNKGGITENVSQKSVEASLSENCGERTKNVTASQLQESVGRSTATQTPGPPLGQPDPVGPSIASDPPALQNGVCQQFPRYGTGQTVRDIFGRLQRLLDHERMYRQSFMEPRNRTNPQSTRRSGGGFNTTPAHSNTAADVWGRWTRRHSDILPERNAEDEGIPYTGQAASVAAERLISALQTELCETERLYQRIVHLPRTAASRDQVPAAPSRETTRQRARQVLCVMVESLTQVFEENDTFHNFSRDDCDSRVRDIYFLLQLSVELVDLLLVQIARPWGNVGTQLESRVESTSNSSHNMRDQISHSRPRGTGSFRFYARRGSGTQRPSDGYSRQTPAGASGTVHPNPARTLSRHRTGRSLGRGPWVNRFSGAPTRFLPGMMQCTASADADPPQASIVSPVMHGDSERDGAISRSSRLPASTRGVRGRSQRGSSTSHDGDHQRHSHLFHNFHNYCRQPEEEEQNQQQHPHPEQNLHYHNQQQHQNQQDVDEEEEQQQQQQQQQEEQQPQQLSLGSWQQQGQSHQQQQEHLEQQPPQRGGHVQERNSDYHSEHSQDQRGNNNREHVTSGSQVLNSSHENREQAQRNSDMFAVPAVQLNDVPIADVGQLSQIEPPHIRPQSPPANPFGVVSRQSQQMLGGLPPSERWLVNFDEVYPNPGLANSNSMAERRLYPPLPFMGYGQVPQSEPSSRPFSSSSPGSNRGPIHNSPPVNDGHMQRPQSDSGSWTYGAPTGWRSRFLHPRYVGPNMFNEEAFSSVENFSFIRGPDTVIITDAPMSPNHRIQAWDISKFHIPDISNAEKNVIVSECKIHNDASVDVSKDGALLVTLLPSNRMCITAMLGVYSLEWESLGQCLYTTSFEQNAVSVSLSPACRHLLVGLASRRIVLPTDRPTVAQIFRMEDAKPGRSIGGRGRLCHLRDIEQNRENSFTSLNCIRWAPEPGQGLVYGTNTGTLKVLR